MRIFKHLETKKVYARTATGLLYELNDRAGWDPTLHTPQHGLRELRKDEYPTLFQSFEILHA